MRYDRLGAGLSDRVPAEPPKVEADARQMEAVLDACGDMQATIFACSCSGLATALFASGAPDRVSRVVFMGAYAARDDIPTATRRWIVDLTRVNWPLAAQMIAGLLDPHASGDEIAAPEPLPAAVGRSGRRRRLPRARPHGRCALLPPSRDGPGARAPPPLRPDCSDRAPEGARLASARTRAWSR